MDQLRQAIDAYLKNSGHSLTGLTRETGVSHTSLKRFMQKEYDKLTMENCFKVCPKVMSNPEECVLQQMRHLTYLLKKEDLGREKVAVQIASESTNRETQMTIHRRTSEYLNEVKGLLEDNPGNITVALGIILAEIH